MPTPDKHALARLRKLVEPFIDAYAAQWPNNDWAFTVSAAHEPLRLGEVLSFEIDGHGTSIEPIWVPHEVCQALAAEIFDLLPPEAGFFSGEDVCDVLSSHLEIAAPFGGPPPSAVDLATPLVEMLFADPPTWEFSVQVATVNATSPIAGAILAELSDQLSSHPAAEDGVHHLQLEGNVVAHTHSGAVTLVQGIALAFAGAAFATGLMTHTGRHIPVRSCRIQINGEGTSLGPSAESILANATVCVPRDVSELERATLIRGAVAEGLGRHVRLLHRAMSSDDGRANEVRNACKIAALAVAAEETGLAVALAFSVVEGLLLDQDQTGNVVARLSEAVAHSLGNTAEERKKLRAATKELYDLRSSFIHSRGIAHAAVARRKALELMLRVIKHEVAQLPPLRDD